MEDKQKPIFLDVMMQEDEKDGFLDPDKKLSEVNPPQNLVVSGPRVLRHRPTVSSKQVSKKKEQKRKKARKLQKQARKKNRK